MEVLGCHHHDPSGVITEQEPLVLSKGNLVLCIIKNISSNHKVVFIDYQEHLVISKGVSLSVN